LAKARTKRNAEQPTTVTDEGATSTSSENRLDIGALEQWLWDAACAVRGAADAPKFKDFILPLIFFKRMSDVFADELERMAEEFGDADVAWSVIEVDHADFLRNPRDLRDQQVRFYVPRGYAWEDIRNHTGQKSLGEFVTEAMRKVAEQNPLLDGVFGITDYNAKQAGQRILDDNRLRALVEVLSRHRLGLKNADPDLLGRAYEYLLRKFAEGQGQSAGEFYTPAEVGRLMGEIINPGVKQMLYDPTCGSGGLLIKAREVFKERHPDKRDQAPRLFGQELNGTTYALAKMNLFLHDYTESEIAIGDTFRHPVFRAGHLLRRFDAVVANPMWNQDNYDDSFYETDSFNRFHFGLPPKSSADWGWVQHMLASLKDTGRAAIVLDTGAAARGSGGRQSNRERAIRKEFLEADLVEGVILLPENLFYNTTAPGIILLLNRNKPEARKGQVILINASQFFVKEKPKNVLTSEGIAAVVDAYGAWETRERLSRVVTLEEVRAADYNLSPSQFVDVNNKVHHRPMADILADLAQARAARERADWELVIILERLQLRGSAT